MQINHFFRRHPFLQSSLISYTTSERRGFERDIYDYARGLGLSSSEARKEVIKGRAFCGEQDYNSDDTTLGGEVDNSAETMRHLITPTVSTLEQSESKQLADVPPIAKAPRQRSRRKKQSTAESLANTDTQGDVIEPKVSTARHQPSEGTSSRFFRNEHEAGKKRKRQGADGSKTGTKKKAKKEGKGQEQCKAPDQLPGLDQADQGIPSTVATTNPKSHSEDVENEQVMQAEICGKTDRKKDGDMLGEAGEEHTAIKNREKRKKRREKSKGPDATTSTISTNPHRDVPEKLDNRAASNEASRPNESASAEMSTSSQDQQPPATTNPAMAINSTGRSSSESKADRAARKLARRERRKADNAERARPAQADKRVVPAAGKPSAQTENHEDPDSHPINQVTGLPAPSINELTGVRGSNGDSTQDDAVSLTTQGPNDPKSATEAHRNFLVSGKQDPNEHGLTADLTDEQQAEQTRKTEEFIAELDALKRFSNQKQAELFDRGQFKHADKQTKDDLKEIKSDLHLEREAEREAEEHQVQVEHERNKKRRQGKTEAVEEHATNVDGAGNVQTKKSKHVKKEEGPVSKESRFQSPMIQLA